jgi:hypothetical protein
MVLWTLSEELRVALRDSRQMATAVILEVRIVGIFRGEILVRSAPKDESMYPMVNLE